MHDGAIVFKTKIDNSDVQKDLDRVKRDIDKSQKSIAESENAKLPLVKQAEQLKATLQEARQELAIFKDEQSAAQTAMQPGAALDDYMAAHEKLPALNAAVEEQKKKVDQLEKEWSQVNGKVEKYNQKISQAQASLEAQKAEAADLSKKLSRGGIDMSGAMEKAQKSAAKFQKRLVSLVSQAFVFTLISKALQGVVKYMGKALKSNSEFTSELAKLRGALLTAFQPVYELLLPALLALMRIATNVVTAVAKVAAMLGGKSVSQYAKNAKALYDEANAIKETGEEAKKAQRSLAGFDEINQLGSNSSEGGSSAQDESAPDFSAFDAGAIKEKVDELTLFLSGALLLIGMVLALSGANIPLGLGLMAVGAIGLASEIAADWDSVKRIIEEKADLIAGISVVLFAVGLILALTGVALPLGIGLMVTGAAGFATAAVLNWDSVKQQLARVLASCMAVVSGGWMVVGTLLCLSGAGLGLGLAMIAAGIAGSITAWNISDNPITRFVKNMANGIIGIVNKIIDAINSLFHIQFKGLKIGGVQIIPKIDTRLLNIPKIPMLAQGAVIPPNREFMAILGDQRHGTNIEAPLETIQEAVAAVMAEYESSNLAGHEATAEILRQILSAVLGIEVGDTTIGQAANRYNEKMAIVRGRA